VVLDQGRYSSSPPGVDPDVRGEGSDGTEKFEWKRGFIPGDAAVDADADDGDQGEPSDKPSRLTGLKPYLHFFREGGISARSAAFGLTPVPRLS
jgi:hypothetical protein